MHNCIFCRIVEGAAPAHKVYETDAVCAFLDINPVNAYHTLVIPKRHYTNVFDVPPDEWAGVMLVVKHLVDLYRERLGIEHVQITNSSGAHAQQDVFHLHVHIIPRHRGDGQNIHRTPHPELRAQFDRLLARLHGES